MKTKTFFSSGSSSFFPLAAATWAKYEITFLVFSVFPAPDSPLECQHFNLDVVYVIINKWKQHVDEYDVMLITYVTYGALPAV